MTVKQLKEYLDKFTPNAKVVIWEWDNPQSGDNVHDCNIGCNFEHQQEKQIVQLYRGLPVIN